MPYVSQDQAAYFHTHEGKDGITSEMVDEWDNATRGKKLPKKIKKKKAFIHLSDKGFKKYK